MNDNQSQGYAAVPTFEYNLMQLVRGYRGSLYFGGELVYRTPRLADKKEVIYTLQGYLSCMKTKADDIINKLHLEKYE